MIPDPGGTIIVGVALPVPPRQGDLIPSGTISETDAGDETTGAVATEAVGELRRLLGLAPEGALTNS
jgi:hypothetical protein